MNRRKKSILSGIFLIVLLLIITLKNDSTAEEYSLINEQIVVTDKIFIEYPQFTGLSDVAKQNILNQMIKDDIVMIKYNYFSGMADFIEGDLSRVDYSIKYDIKWKSSYLLSIYYNESFYFKGATHPSGSKRIHNIDVSKEKFLKLSDILIIDQALIEKIKKGKISGADNPYLQELLNLWNTGYLKPERYDSMYFSKDGLVFPLDKYSSAVSVDYRDVADNMKNKNDKIWRGLLKEE